MGWHKENALVVGSVSGRTSVALNPLTSLPGMVYIVANQLYYKYWTGSAWSSSETIATVKAGSIFCCLDFDSSGQAHVLFVFGPNPPAYDYIKHCYRTGPSAWVAAPDIETGITSRLQINDVRMKMLRRPSGDSMQVAWIMDDISGYPTGHYAKVTGVNPPWNAPVEVDRRTLAYSASDQPRYYHIEFIYIDLDIRQEWPYDLHVALYAKGTVSGAYTQTTDLTGTVAYSFEIRHYMRSPSMSWRGDYVPTHDPVAERYDVAYSETQTSYDPVQRFGSLAVSVHEIPPHEHPEVPGSEWGNLKYIHIVWEAGSPDRSPLYTTGYPVNGFFQYNTISILNYKRECWDTLVLRRDALNRLHFVNWDKNDNKLLYWLKDTSGTWTKQEAYSNSGRYGYLVLDSNNYPHISHNGFGNLNYLRWTGDDLAKLRVSEDGASVTGLPSDLVNTSPLKIAAPDPANPSLIQAYKVPLVVIDDELASKVRVSLTSSASGVRAVLKLKND